MATFHQAIARGLAADRPATGHVDGALWFSTDSAALTRWNAGAAAWQDYGSAGLGAEAIRDLVAGFLVAGAGVSLTHDDGADSLTVAATVTQYTDEMARDAVGAALVAGANVTVSVNDAGDQITIAAAGGGATSLDGLSDVVVASPADGHVLRHDGTDWDNVPEYVLLPFVIDGGGAAITAGVKGDLGPIPFDFYVEDVTLLADQSGSIVVDIWADSYANFPPVDADSITASAPPTLSSALKGQDSTLTGWSRTHSSGVILRYNVDSAATIARVTVALRVRRLS